MIFGVNATRSAVIVAETKGASDKFVITAIKPIPFQVRSGDDLAELLQTLILLFDRKGKGAGSVIALLKCSSGRFGSCLEAIKGEAMVELAASQRGLRIVKIAPQSLKKTLGWRRIKSGGIVPGNCSIPTANVRTGPRAQPEPLLPPSRLLASDVSGSP